MTTALIDKLEQILEKYADEQGSLIQVLLDVQSEYNWLPEEVLQTISERLAIPRTYIYRVASFYTALNLTPVGKHQVSVCMGTACHVHGGDKILRSAEEFLGIKDGGTTEDLRFTLKSVNCLGCCAIGPVVLVDDEYYGRITPSKLRDILKTVKD